MTKRPIRFLRAWIGRPAGHIERGFDYGVAASLVRARVCEWMEETPPAKEAVAQAIPVPAVMPAAYRDDRQAKRPKR